MTIMLVMAAFAQTADPMGGEAALRAPRIISVIEKPKKRTYTPPSPIGDQGDWFPVDAYPAAARRAGEQGRVSVRLDLDDSGKPVGCTVERSSGSATLDQATCDLAVTNGRFKPATDGRKRIPSRFLIRNVAWVLDEAPAIDITDGEKILADNVIEVTIDAKGIATACRATRINPPQVDPCANAPIGKREGPLMTRNGQPVGGRMVLSIRSVFIPDPAPRP